MIMGATMAAKNRKSSVIFDQKPGGPKRPLPHHERRAIMERHLVLKSTKPVLASNQVLTNTGGVSPLDHLIPQAVVREEKVTHIKMTKGRDELWQGMVTKKLPSMDHYIEEGVEYKDIPMSVVVKGFRRLRIILREVTNGDEVRFYSLFKKNNGKRFESDVVNRVVRDTTGIIIKLFEGREISEENETIFADAVKDEKIVWELAKPHPQSK